MAWHVRCVLCTIFWCLVHWHAQGCLRTPVQWPSTRLFINYHQLLILPDCVFSCLLLCRPLVGRLWPPLRDVAEATKTQYQGRLPARWLDRDLQHRSSGHANGGREGAVATAGSTAGGSAAAPASSSQQPQQQQRDAMPAWRFSVFPEPKGAAGGGAQSKYVAQPRRLTGVVLVGAATRTPAVRQLVHEVRVGGGMVEGSRWFDRSSILS